MPRSDILVSPKGGGQGRGPTPHQSRVILTLDPLKNNYTYVLMYNSDCKLVDSSIVYKFSLKLFVFCTIHSVPNLPVPVLFLKRVLAQCPIIYSKNFVMGPKRNCEK